MIAGARLCPPQHTTRTQRFSARAVRTGLRQLSKTSPHISQQLSSDAASSIMCESRSARASLNHQQPSEARQ